MIPVCTRVYSVDIGSTIAILGSTEVIWAHSRTKHSPPVSQEQMTGHPISSCGEIDLSMDESQ